MKRISICLLILVLFTMTVAAGMGAYMSGNGGKRADITLKDRLDSEIPKVMKESGVPGVAIMVIDGDTSWTREYGYADKAGKKPVTADTVFQVGSVSKSLAAWGVMKLVEDGKIELDAPIDRYVKRWHLPESQYDSDGVTIRRLLSHTAGLSLHGYGGVEPDKELATLEESLSGKTGGAGDVRIVLEPGTQFSYSGGGYTLLQLMIEEVSGKPFEKYMEDEILKPLGMDNSSFEWKEEIRPEVSKAYGVLGQTMPNYLYTEKAAAGLYTTAKDLAKFAAAGMSMSGDEPAGMGVLKADTVNSMEQDVSKAEYGLGYEVFSLSNGRKVVGHSGANRGWRAQYYIVPESKQGLVVLTNSDMGQNVLNRAGALWMEQQTGNFPDFYYSNLSSNTNLLNIALAIGVLLVVFLAVVLRGIALKKRTLEEWRKRKPFNKALRLLLPVLLLLAWWIGLYGPVAHGWNVAEFLPVTLKWVSMAVTLWCLALLLAGVFPKVKVQKKSKKTGKALEA